MLGKLLKYEFKSTARVFFPFFIAILGLSIISKLSFTFFSNPAPALRIPQGLLAFLYMLMIIAAFVLCFIITIQRYYKNLLGAEGYLMFTLPVTPTANILSKGIAALVWMLSTCAVTVVSVFLLMPDYDWLPHFREEWTKVTQEIYQQSGLRIDVILWMAAALLIAAFCAFIMEVYAAVSIGQLADNHKLACSFAAFIGIYVVEQIINSAVMSSILLPQFTELWSGNHSLQYNMETGYQYMTTLLAFALVSEAVYAVGCFFVTRWLMGKKLNLE